VIKKQYYRLSDLRQLKGISEEDVRYWMERDELPLLFYRTDAFFLAGDRKPNAFHGHCYVSYRGLVELELFHDQFLLDDGYTETTTCYLTELDRVDSLGGGCPTSIAPPNIYISSWDPKEPEEIEGDKIFAMENHTLSILEANDPEPEGGFFRSRDNSSARFHIVVHPHRYSFNDLILTDETLFRLGVLKSDELADKIINEQVNISENTNSIVSSNRRRKQDVREVLETIIKTYPNISAKGAWSHLENEVQMDPEQRKFDRYNVLRSMSENEIYWVSRYENSGYLKFKSIGPTLSRIKKALKIVKN
jgi:hypothetical protein